MTRSIDFHYRDLKQDLAGATMHQLLVSPSEATLPFAARPSTQQIRKALRRTHGIVFVASGSLIGPTFDDYHAARLKIQQWGGDLVASEDFASERVRAMLADPRMTAIMAGIPECYPIRVAPTTNPIESFVAMTNHTVMFTGTDVQIHLKTPADETDVAHEIMHVPMMLEGYGMSPDALTSDYAMTMVSSVLDIEVDRRVAEAGFDPVATTDDHLQERAARSVLRLSQTEALSEIVMRTMLDTRIPTVRDDYVAHLRKCFPKAATAGDRILDACGGRAGLRTAAGANAGLLMASDLAPEFGEEPFGVEVFRQDVQHGSSTSNWDMFTPLRHSIHRPAPRVTDAALDPQPAAATAVVITEDEIDVSPIVNGPTP